MSYVDGLGGAFVFSEDPERLADWYERTFGISFERAGEDGAFYTVFWARDPDDPARRLDTTFSIMRSRVPLGSGRGAGAEAAEGADPAGAETRAADADPDVESMYGDQPFMVNLRIRDMDALLADLEAKGVEILKREEYDYGRFAWVRDPDGSRVELYEPGAG